MTCARPPFFPLELAYATYDASLTYISDDVVLFWHPPLAFSQWTPSPFTVDLVEYICTEQFMMASKARLFGDDTALSTILASDNPREQKRLGRQVRHFDHDLWPTECENIVLHSNLAKFSQNEEMRLALIRTGDRRLAEASLHEASHPLNSPTRPQPTRIIFSTLEHCPPPYSSDRFRAGRGWLGFHCH